MESFRTSKQKQKCYLQLTHADAQIGLIELIRNIPT